MKTRPAITWVIGCLPLISLLGAAACNDLTGPSLCGGWECWDFSKAVESPPPGIPADREAICAADPVGDGGEDAPLVSNAAARVFVDNHYDSCNNASTDSKAVIRIPPDLLPYVVGEPTIDVKRICSEATDAGDREQPMSFQVDGMLRASYGFDFFVRWVSDTAQVKVYVTLEISCDEPDGGLLDAGPGALRRVESATYMDWCYLEDTPSPGSSQTGWVS